MTGIWNSDMDFSTKTKWAAPPPTSPLPSIWAWKHAKSNFPLSNDRCCWKVVAINNFHHYDSCTYSFKLFLFTLFCLRHKYCLISSCYLDNRKLAKKMKRVELKRGSRKTLATIRQVIGKGHYRTDLKMVRYCVFELRFDIWLANADSQVSRCSEHVI